MAVVRVLKAAGLYTGPSTLTSPAGSFARSTNTVVNYPDVLESRRGFEYLPEAAGTTTVGTNALFSYLGVVLKQYGTALAYFNGSGFVDYSGTNAPPDPGVLRMKGREANLNFYFTSTQGIKGIDSPTATPFLTGLPKGPVCRGLQGGPTKAALPDQGWMPADSQVAYVAVYARKDANENLKLSTPSNPIFVINPPQFTVKAGDMTRVSNLVTAIIKDPNDVLRAAGYDVNSTIQSGPITGSDGISLGYSTVTERFVDAATGWYYIRWAGAGPDTTSTVDHFIKSGSQDVDVTVAISPDTTLGTFVQIYRTRATLSCLAVPEPQYYLCYEQILAAGNISGGSFSVRDQTPEGFLRDPLYTNTQDGQPADSSPDNDNSQMPAGTDLENWDGRLWTCNTQERQSFTLNLLGTAAPNGLVPGDTITVAGVTYQAVLDPLPAGNTLLNGNITFQVPDFNSTYLNSAEERLAFTAQSLALTIEQNANSPVGAYYASGVSDIPGRIEVTARAAISTPFAVYASKPTAWAPPLTTTSTGAITSSSSPASNGLAYSKQEQPEAVPLFNRLPIGPKNCRILRIGKLRDKLYVFTDIAGIWTVSNTYPYRVDQLTKTAALLAPDTLDAFDDALYALTTQGVTKITESGPSVLSGPVESDLKRLYGVALPVLKLKSVAVGYESYRKYLLACPAEANDTANTQVLVYDTYTQTWNRWDKPMSALVVVPQSDVLYVARATSNRVSVERKNFDRTDYADESYIPSSLTVLSADTLSVVTTTAPVAGDRIVQDPVVQATITSVTTTAPNTYTVTLNRSGGGWTGGSVTVYPGIDSSVLWNPLHAGQPEEAKHVREVCYHFRAPALTLGNGVFFSDINPAEERSGIDLGGVGQRPATTSAWAQSRIELNERVGVPFDSSRSAFLYIGFQVREAWAQWGLNGFSAVLELDSERNTE